MKVKILGIILIFLAMCAVPLIATNNNQNYKTEKEASEPTNIIEASTSTAQYNTLFGIILNCVEPDFNDETIKAICLICNSAYKFDEKIIEDKKDELYLSEDKAKEKFSDKYDSIIEKVDNSIKKISNFRFCYKNEPVYVPWFYSSRGSTKSDENYEYLVSVASPWDLLCNNSPQEKSGISLYGLNYLIEKGENYKSALLWYLPLCEIKAFA